MGEDVISADCHVDLIWLPPDLFTSNAQSQMKDRMPYVVDGEKGKKWVSRNGAEFGLMNGMGSAGREYVPGAIARSDRMAAEGLFEDGKKGIRRLTDPDLRVKDQDRDGIRGEVLYGILGASQRLNDPEASIDMMRIYNEWLSDFCQVHPTRYAGIASIPNHDMKAAVAEVERVARRGGLKGIEIANSHDLKPLYHPYWQPLWEAANEAKLPVHFHTIGHAKINTEGFAHQQIRQAAAVSITGFQMAMSRILMEVIYGGILESYQDLKVIIGESGIGWLPYVLDHMDLEWEEQFHNDLTLTMKPSEYWSRQCYATYQSDPVGIRLIDMMGEDNIMWGSDFPHPDGVWPDSQEYIEREMADVDPAIRRKIVFENAAKLYGFPM
ncbi:MAG: amidohydrolase family protein [Alphaproteobacteria bacterium]|nr:amidohydrolase family protein [Alphaproteobacteria bacterium]